MVNMDGLSDTSSSASPVPSNSVRDRSHDHSSLAGVNNVGRSGGGGGNSSHHHLLVDDPSLEASKMLEAALQQMDGIISGECETRCDADFTSFWNVFVISIACR